MLERLVWRDTSLGLVTGILYFLQISSTVTKILLKFSVEYCLLSSSSCFAASARWW